MGNGQDEESNVFSERLEEFFDRHETVIEIIAFLLFVGAVIVAHQLQIN
jgi:hypothetical protein